MGDFHLFADVAKYGRTYNRPVERSGDGKPSVGSNSQSVSINENVFQSFNSYAKAVLGNKSVDMSGKYGTSNAGAESVGVSDCNKDLCGSAIGIMGHPDWRGVYLKLGVGRWGSNSMFTGSMGFLPDERRCSWWLGKLIFGGLFEEGEIREDAVCIMMVYLRIAWEKNLGKMMLVRFLEFHSQGGLFGNVYQ
ncbi:hypothetical protein Tco_0786507 [Tanacetum coccineum]